MSDLKEEIGRAIEWYCDNHEGCGYAWLVCKLNDIAYDAEELTEQVKESIKSNAILLDKNEELTERVKELESDLSFVLSIAQASTISEEDKQRMKSLLGKE